MQPTAHTEPIAHAVMTLLRAGQADRPSPVARDYQHIGDHGIVPVFPT